MSIFMGLISFVGVTISGYSAAMRVSNKKPHVSVSFCNDGDLTKNQTKTTLLIKNIGNRSATKIKCEVYCGLLARKEKVSILSNDPPIEIKFPDDPCFTHVLSKKGDLHVNEEMPILVQRFINFVR